MLKLIATRGAYSMEANEKIDFVSVHSDQVKHFSFIKIVFGSHILRLAIFLFPRVNRY